MPILGLDAVGGKGVERMAESLCLSLRSVEQFGDLTPRRQPASSWHAGTGATDNAAGCAVAMEAMRILKSLGQTPRRTIRIALWSGEEQGLLGSRGWVEDHPELHDRISAYLNVDNGTGRIRGIWDQSNERAIPIFEQTLWPFRDLGVVAVDTETTGLDEMRAGLVGVCLAVGPGEAYCQPL